MNATFLCWLLAGFMWGGGSLIQVAAGNKWLALMYAVVGFLNVVVAGINYGNNIG